MNVEIGKALVVAVEIEHDVVAERELDQPVLQPPVGAAEADVRQKLGVWRGKQRKRTVEVGAGAKIEAALMLAKMILGAADRIGPGHDGDGALDAAFRFRLGQHRHQRVNGDDARQFTGMQRGLQIG